MNIKETLAQYKRDWDHDEDKYHAHVDTGSGVPKTTEALDYLRTASYYKLAGAEVIAVKAGAVAPSDCVTADGRATASPTAPASYGARLALARLGA